MAGRIGNNGRLSEGVFCVIVIKVLTISCLYSSFVSSTIPDTRGFPFIVVPQDQTRAERLEEINTSFPQRLAAFDGQFYLQIARQGYEPGTGAFFPLLPLVMRACSWVFDDPVPAVVALNILISAAALFALWHLARALSVPATTSLLVAATFPTAMFQYFLYTESLFLLLSVLTALFVVQGRRRRAAVCAYLCGLCRPQGILVTVLLMSPRPENDSWQSATKRPGYWLGALAPALGVATVLWLQRDVGLFAFVTAQESWDRSLEWTSLFSGFQEVLARPFSPDSLALIVALLLLPVAGRHLPRSFAVYVALSLALPLLTGRSLSLCRFLSVCFPCFLALAVVLERSRPLMTAYSVLAFSLQIACARVVISWRFLA